MENYFAELNAIDVTGKTEKKNGLTYLSWAWAWGELKKRHPDAVYTIYENAEGYFYHTDGKTCWVKTGVTVNGIEHIEYLPVMDVKNRSIPADSVTSFDVNKAIQRSLTKAVARHGLGLYIYAGEDLPDDGETRPSRAEKPDLPPADICADCGGQVLSIIAKDGQVWPIKKTKEFSRTRYGRLLCQSCMEKAEKKIRATISTDTAKAASAVDERVNEIDAKN